MDRNFEKLNYYEVLDVPIDASPFEIRQAYREALALYDRDSLSTYALFSEEERTRILERIEEAFATLIDEEKRAAYERHLAEKGDIDAAEAMGGRTKEPVPLFASGSAEARSGILNRIKNKILERRSEMDFEGILSKDRISGADLKEIREALGIQIQEVFEVTRINVSTITALEEDRFNDLPPLIFLKGFLKSYAELFGLPAGEIVDGYLRHMDQAGKG
ncbi:MAG: helix-turn-helix domain-containing protein [Deltaproteobacteria bacterium]|nr:helix-turn-helix domain-containing protein [Deltaproteobacteria bacterium]MBW2016695.1 helix-turn-helix domain-containing protein [Deltaproteobacteria bacterium]MBW2128070.1 helix-turn-helix domain-containing protein [Deltaproteobacteria bacterium]MBW2304090.1 helix-turn-helix domain-containing protein [Deltaproteobacteria bacterium]